LQEKIIILADPTVVQEKYYSIGKLKAWFSVVPGTLLTPMRFSKTDVFFEYIAMRIAAEIVTF